MATFNLYVMVAVAAALTVGALGALGWLILGYFRKGKLHD